MKNFKKAFLDSHMNGIEKIVVNFRLQFDMKPACPGSHRQVIDLPLFLW